MVILSVHTLCGVPGLRGSVCLQNLRSRHWLLVKHIYRAARVPRLDLPYEFASQYFRQLAQRPGVPETAMLDRVQRLRLIAAVACLARTRQTTTPKAQRPEGRFVGLVKPRLFRLLACWRSGAGL